MAAQSTCATSLRSIRSSGGYGPRRQSHRKCSRGFASCSLVALAIPPEASRGFVISSGGRRRSKPLRRPNSIAAVISTVATMPARNASTLRLIRISLPASDVRRVEQSSDENDEFEHGVLRLWVLMASPNAGTAKSPDRVFVLDTCATKCRTTPSDLALFPLRDRRTRVSGAAAAVRRQARAGSASIEPRRDARATRERGVRPADDA